MRPTRFTPGDQVWVCDPKYRDKVNFDTGKIEWVEENLKVTGVVSPGHPAKLNTMDRAVRGDAWLGRIVRLHDRNGVTPRGGIEGENVWDVWDPEDLKERVMPESWLLLESEWELVKSTKGI